MPHVSPTRSPSCHTSREIPRDLQASPRDASGATSHSHNPKAPDASADTGVQHSIIRSPVGAQGNTCAGWRGQWGQWDTRGLHGCHRDDRSLGRYEGTHLLSGRRGWPNKNCSQASGFRAFNRRRLFRFIRCRLLRRRAGPARAEHHWGLSKPKLQLPGPCVSELGRPT